MKLGVNHNVWRNPSRYRTGVGDIAWTASGLTARNRPPTSAILTNVSLSLRLARWSSADEDQPSSGVATGVGIQKTVRGVRTS